MSATRAALAKRGSFDVLPANRELAGAEVETGRAGAPRDAAEGRAGRGRRRLRLRPDRLPAGAVAAHAERPVRGGRRAHPDAVRVLRARRPVRPGRHDQAGARQPEPGPGDRRPAAHDVRPAQHAVSSRCQRQLEAALRRQGVQHRHPAQRAPGRGAELRHAGRGVRPGVEGRAGLPRVRRARWSSASRSRIDANRKQTTQDDAWQRKKPKGLGRGLEALLGGDADTAEPATPPDAPSHAAGRSAAGRQVPAAHAHGRRRAVRAGRVDQGAGRDAADPGAPGRRRRDAQYEIIAGERRWRAAQLAGLDERAGAGARRARRGRRRDGADREHPARGPQSAGRGAGPAAPDRRIRPHARAGGGGGRPLAQRGVATCCAC